MIKPDLNDKLIRIFDTCDLHLKRMDFAKSKVIPFIPLNWDTYYTMDEETISFLDQFIFRYAKLQDLMGNRLFPSLMEALAEPASDKTYIDILNRLEKLYILNSASGWIQLRKIRNDIAHEYPTALPERIEGMNILFQSLDELREIIERCKSVFR